MSKHTPKPPLKPPKTPAAPSLPGPDQAPAAAAARADQGGGGAPGLSIHSLPSIGRWRAGRKWTPEAQIAPCSDFNDAQIEALRNDPLLVVIDVEI